MTTDIGRKRARDMDDVPESADPGRVPRPLNGDSTKRMRSAQSATSSPLPYIVVHRVECTLTERYHEQHVPSADFFDAPRLLAQSNRKTCLQGRKPIKDIESFLEDNDHLSFAVYITYSCTKYHEKIKDEFKRLTMPVMDEAIAAEAKPFFYVLQRDARPATAESEALILSEGLQEALYVLDAKVSTFRWVWEDPSYLMYPYLHLYHHKDLLTGTATREVKPHHQTHLEALHNYLVEHLGPEYSESESLFGRGYVDREHWSKLFRPGSVVVSFEGGQPVAHVCETCPTLGDNDLHLQCWSWAFDGKFFQNNAVLQIPWPSDGNIVAITDLQVYPLARAMPGLEDELRARGEVFWACRSRKFVNYNVPLEGMEVQNVRLSFARVR